MSSAWQNAAHGQGWIAWLDSGEWETMLDTFSPMLPALSVEIACLARDPDISVIRLAQIIGKDPILAVNVVRLANSAFSASATTITSLNDAVVRVGTRAVRQLVTAACLTSKLRNPKTYGVQARELVDHSVSTAYIAWLVAERVGADPDAAFLYGLLHDIGKFVILKLAHDDRPIPSTMGEERLAACIDSRHAAIGGRVLACWKFAAEIQMPVAWHHDPAQAHDHARSAAIAYAANLIAHSYAQGRPADTDALCADPVLAGLGLDAALLSQLEATLPALFDVAHKIAA